MCREMRNWMVSQSGISSATPRAMELTVGTYSTHASLLPYRLRATSLQCGITVLVFTGIPFMQYYTSLALSAALIATLLFGTTSCADEKKPDTKEVAEDLNDQKFDTDSHEQDAQFLVNAAEMSREQISLGQLAQQRGKTKHVRDLGKMMETAHTTALEEITALAKSKSASIPTATTDAGTDAFRKLTDIAAKSFDLEYANMTVGAHKDAIAMFEKTSTDSKDADVKSWANNTLPSLRTHLEESLTCQKMCEKK